MLKKKPVKKFKSKADKKKDTPPFVEKVVDHVTMVQIAKESIQRKIDNKVTDYLVSSLIKLHPIHDYINYDKVEIGSLQYLISDHAKLLEVEKKYKILEEKIDIIPKWIRWVLNLN